MYYSYFVFDFMYSHRDLNTFLSKTLSRILFRPTSQSPISPLLFREALPLGDIRLRVKRAKQTPCFVNSTFIRKCFEEGGQYETGPIGDGIEKWQQYTNAETAQVFNAFTGPSRGEID